MGGLKDLVVNKKKSLVDLVNSINWKLTGALMSVPTIGEAIETFLSKDHKFYGHVEDIISRGVPTMIMCGMGIYISKLLKDKEDISNKLKSNHDLLYQIIDSVESPIFFKDNEGKYQIFNQSFNNFLGLSDEEILGKTVHEVAPSEQADLYHQKDLELMASGNNQIYETKVKFNDGSFHDVRFIKSPVRGKGKSLEGLVGVMLDITEFNQVNEQLMKSNERLKHEFMLETMLMDSLPNPTFIIRLSDRKILTMNKTAKDMGINSDSPCYHGIQMSSHLSNEQKEAYIKTQIHCDGVRCNFCLAEESIRDNTIKSREVEMLGKTWDLKWVPVDVKGGIYLHYAIDITERTEKEKELKLAKEKAESSEKFKSRFLANMSHEIRSPLNSVLGFAELLSKKTNLDSDSKENLSLIIQEGKHLLDIINEVLELAKIESSGVSLNYKPVSINEILKTVYGFGQGYFANKANQLNSQSKLELKLNLPEGDILTSSDKTKLTQVMYNLVNNAIKFTQEGYIEIGARLDNSTIIMYVKDTGEGIKEEYHSAIFDNFFQIKDSHSQARGTGLGLPISKKYVDALEGNIFVESTLGEGSTFTVCLPYLKLSSNVRSLLINNNNNNNNNNVDKEINSELENRLENKSILIVDDNDINLKLMGAMLSKLFKTGQVYNSLNGYGALDILKSKDIDFIITDLEMEGISGYELASNIRGMGAKYQTIPIVALSANVMGDVKERALMSGCNDYLEKPVSIKSLSDMLNKYLKD